MLAPRRALRLVVAACWVAATAGKRECNPVTTLVGTEAALAPAEFSCGGSGEVLEVQSVTQSANATQCSAAKATFAGPCDGNEECKVDASEYSGCGLAVEMKCKDSGVDTFTILVLLLIFIIILAMGTTCTLEDARTIWASKKRAFVVGWLSQFGFMPLFAFSAAKAFKFDSLVAVGVVLCGAAPGGTTSNLFTYWSGGNVSLSIAMSLASTACAVFMLPLLVEIYIIAGLGLDGGSVTIPFQDIVIIAVGTILVPATLGVLLRRYNTEWKIRGKFIYKWVEIAGSVIGGLTLAAAVVVGLDDNPDLMNPMDYPGEWILASIFQPVGCLFGLCAATLLRLDGPDRIAVALETGVQNYTLVIGICALSFSGCTRVEALTFVFIGSAWYIVSSAWLVALLRTARKRGWWRLDEGRAPGDAKDVVDGGVCSSSDKELTVV